MRKIRMCSRLLFVSILLTNFGHQQSSDVSIIVGYLLLV